MYTANHGAVCSIEDQDFRLINEYIIIPRMYLHRNNMIIILCILIFLPLFNLYIRKWWTIEFTQTTVHSYWGLI